MNKKLFLVVMASFVVTFSGLNSLPASAEGIEPRTVENYDDEIENTSDEIDVTTNCLGSDSEIPENCTEVVEEENEVEGGDPDESLVVCADKDEPGCEPDSEQDVTEESDEEEDTEPVLWPMIISLSALGLAAVIIIVLNLTGPKIK